METDVQLMLRVAAGENEAMRTLYRRFWPVLVAIAGRTLRPEDAEEIAAEALAQAWIKARKFDPAKASLKTWIVRIAQRKIIDAYRRTRARINGLPLEAACGVAVADRAVDTDRLDRALWSMNAGQREWFGLYARGSSYRAIATMSGAKIGTVKSRLNAGRRNANPHHAGRNCPACLRQVSDILEASISTAKRRTKSGE